MDPSRSNAMGKGKGRKKKMIKTRSMFSSLVAGLADVGDVELGGDLPGLANK